METITLYFKQGSSDKVYQASIEPSGSQFVVNFAYGRRGSTMATGTKTSSPVDYNAAKSIYDKLVREKTAKGYTPGVDGTPYRHTENNNRQSGFVCQLLETIDEAEAIALCQNPDYCMQEKFDGKRRPVRKTTKGEVSGINKLGLVCDLPAHVHEWASSIPTGFLDDNEAVDDVLHTFDLLENDSADLRPLGYRKRYEALEAFLNEHPHPSVILVKTAWTTGEKLAMFARCKVDKREGVVFKRIDAPYTPGTCGGSQFKFKFCESASCIVGKVNIKRSVSLKLFDGTDLVPVGNVTIPANKEIPDPDDVVEVRYLYAFEGGSLFQPVYLGARDDVRSEECSVDQLKFKTEPQAAAA